MFKAKTPEGRLDEARRCFDRYMDHWRKSRQLQLSDANFYHNVDGVSQWDSESLKILAEQNRPALTFNLIAFKVNQGIGLHEEHKHAPKVVPVSGSEHDVALAGALDALLYRAREDMELDELDSQIYELGLVMGEGDLALETKPMKKDSPPGWMHITGEVVQPTCVMWDPSSESRDRRDASGVIWDKWVSYDRFVSSYPEHKSHADAMLGNEPWTAELPIEDQSLSEERDYSEVNSEYYVNRKEKEIRVIHYEYFCITPKYTLVDYVAQAAQEIDEEFAKKIESAQEMDDPRFADVAVETEYVEEWRWFEFIGNAVLFEGLSPEPYEGFSLTPFLAYMDTVTGWPYGIVRNMKDPQRDINKAHSQSLDHLNAQGKPGWIGEKSAVPDVETFEQANSQAASMAIVEDGALTQQRVRERPVPVYSEAANQRLERGINLLHLVAGISSEPEDPSRGVETATSVGIRERKALRSLTRILRSFEKYQRKVAKKMLTAILSKFPDDQITAWLNSDGRFQVQNGTIYRMAEGPQGPTPEPLANIRDLREVYYSVELETSTQSDTDRLITLQSVLMMIQSDPQGRFPIDPGMIYDLIAPNRSYRERLREFGKQASMSQAQTQEQNLKIQIGEMRAEHTKEQRKLELERGKAMADIKLRRQEMKQDALLEFLDLWQTAEDSEKQYIVATAKMLIDSDDKQKANEMKAAAPAAPTTGVMQ